MNGEQREQYRQLDIERAIVNGEWFLFLSGKGARPGWIPKEARSRTEWEAAHLRRLLPIVARMRELLEPCHDGRVAGSPTPPQADVAKKSNV